jgi:hypothetical protein
LNLELESLKFQTQTLDRSKRVAGIEIEDAGRSADLSRLELLALPFKDVVLSEKQPAQP